MGVCVDVHAPESLAPSRNAAMLVKDQPAPVRSIEDDHDFAETRLEAVGFVFHGFVPSKDKKTNGRVKAGSNLLHFARCGKLERVPETEDKVWYRSIRVAKTHLDETVGAGRWKWCKVCEREITQRILNEV
jgi:hypothetical protein